MASRLPSSAVFMEKVPTFEWLRGNLFRITDPNTGIVRIAEASVLAESIAAAATSYRDYRQRESAEIIKFPNHAASS